MLTCKVGAGCLAITDASSLFFSAWWTLLAFFSFAYWCLRRSLFVFVSSKNKDVCCANSLFLEEVPQELQIARGLFHPQSPVRCC